MLKNPSVYSRLVSELSTLPENFTDADLQKLPYLKAVIQEGLRLYTPAAASLPRTVPPEGAKLAGYWIPGGTTVGAQAYTLHRDEKIFPDPLT